MRDSDQFGKGFFFGGALMNVFFRRCQLSLLKNAIASFAPYRFIGDGTNLCYLALVALFEKHLTTAWKALLSPAK